MSQKLHPSAAADLGIVALHLNQALTRIPDPPVTPLQQSIRAKVLNMQIDNKQLIKEFAAALEAESRDR